MTGKNKIFKANEKDVLIYVAAYHKKNPEEIIVFDTVESLVTDHNFLDLILKEKVQFTSIKDQKWADKFSKSIGYASSYGRGGNHFVGEVAIASANEFSKEMGSLFDYLDRKNFNSLKQKADFLNHYGITTKRDSHWTKTAVSRTHKRWQKLNIK